MRWFRSEDLDPLLDAPSCLAAVENAFRTRGDGGAAPSVAAGLELAEGVLHAKLARLDLSRSYAVAKINANIPSNPSARGLPTIQGVLALFDASNGVPLAIMDSATITAARTAATSAVAAKHLARSDASSVAIIGCGVQARPHLAALRCVRQIERVLVFDVDQARAERFVADVGVLCGVAAGGEVRGIEVIVAKTVREAALTCDIIVTATPSRRPVLVAGDVPVGAFVAAVGADNEHKQEIDVELLRASVVVVDDLDQCARMGDLHHAVRAGAMSAKDVRGSLDEVVAGVVRGRRNAEEIIVFDSTGLAIEDCAVAAMVFEQVGEADPSSLRSSG